MTAMTLGPVLMVHGMCCTGAVWSRFRGLFEAQGAAVHAPTLRPELRVRRSPPRGLREVGFDDYVQDLSREATSIAAATGHKPAVIGHSMGGLLAQALAERGLVRAAVLISPSAPAGVRTLPMRLFWKAVGLGDAFGLVPGTIFSSRRNVEALVLNCVPEAERKAAYAGLVHESGRAFADLGHYPIDESKIRVPVLTVAAGKDRLVPAALVRLTARKYAAVGGDFREYAHHGHWLYAEPGWDKAASDIADWIRARAPAG
jgi:alpha-beta hydrolase superfamily lysophospholipase